MGKMLDNLKEYFEDEESLRKFNEAVEKEANKQSIYLSQVDRFSQRILSDKDFEYYLEKILDKYDTDSYYYRWINRGIEPPKDLLFFLFDYAEKYGRECTDKEIEDNINMFTDAIYYVHGYYIQRIVGQGCAIIIKKENENTTQLPNNN